MNTSQIDRLSQALAGRVEIRQDADGRLFQPMFRQTLEAFRDGLDPPPPDLVAWMAGIEAVAAMRWAAKLVHLAMERWADGHGLSEGRLQLLFLLRMSREGVPMSTMARLQHVSPRNITGLVDMLERDGLVERVPDPADRRSVLARLTEAGSERIDAIWRQALEAQSPLTRGFETEELVQFRHLCLRLVRNLMAETGEGAC